ncbi:type II toxin-antitoxin system RelB/DinJ family antitoxin [Bifidobacterium sp.]|uniref:type II toxin-antitoxin system RelB/DinJ family antitoxin n=1 Tax=Bifidobacterium sp. TaxID=41200 RepID=UPI003D7CC842
MSDTATISFRTDPTIKREAKELYADMGMDLSTAINIFLRQSIRENGMPFKITRENPINVEARRQAENHDGESFTSTDALMKDLLDA